MKMRLAIGVMLMVVACGDADVPPPADYSNLGSFDTVAVEIITAGDTLEVQAELAASEEQRQLGLMERTQLPEDHGMLFVYDEVQDSTASFWMYRTRIPLDIAFVDTAGRIVAIRTMQPCESPYAQRCPVYPAGAPFSSALEMNQGYFQRHGVQLGDIIRRRPGS